ncbi:putative lipid II flippase MurJ [Methylacidimicrobium sp. AP8]|uniref:murein biosynthesis integral membrane protein MurJ n=1 Tax=Methylacidimicrobium sp. AP8 TaxID=2730359 RepID=UPI0018C12602|nr:murein biosynthesis integral membrane protein MurJ [Methylacidimicrobium sp. AP8]CAB4244271.1 putative lipid II flippase MurJ [Methylacidimicrobium sp. AP8]
MSAPNDPHGPPPAAAPARGSGESNAAAHRAAGVVSLAVMGSRIFGLVRELVFAALFGAGKLLDAYLAAFQIPNLLRDLFAEGALSTAFTTVFAKTWEEQGKARAFSLANHLLAVLFLFLSAVCLAGIALAPLLIEVTSFGFHAVPGKFELTVRLTRILFPFILFVALAAVAMGILNAGRIFGLPASASTAFNIVSVVLGVFFAYTVDPQRDPLHPSFGEAAVYGVCFGVLLGGLAQLLIQVPAFGRIGYRWRWELDPKDPKLREIWRLMVPSMIAGAAVQVNVLVNGMFASEINGGRSWLNCAFRLMQFPIGVFGVAIATVTLPTVSRQHARADLDSFRRTLRHSLRLGLFYTVPAAVGLAVLSEPLIRLIYQHGRFSSWDTHQTAAALEAYTLGLAGYAGIKILAPCFYALDAPAIPLRVSLFGIGLNLLLNLFLVKVLAFGHVGLALTTSLVALLNAAQLFFSLDRRVFPGGAGSWLSFLWRLALASAACGLAAAGLVRAAERSSLPGLPLGDALLVAGAVAAGALAFFAAARALGLEECREAIDLLRRIVFRRRNGRGRG